MQCKGHDGPPCLHINDLEDQGIKMKGGSLWGPPIRVGGYQLNDKHAAERERERSFLFKFWMVPFHHTFVVIRQWSPIKWWPPDGRLRSNAPWPTQLDGFGPMRIIQESSYK